MGAAVPRALICYFDALNFLICCLLAILPIVVGSKICVLAWPTYAKIWGTGGR